MLTNDYIFFLALLLSIAPGMLIFLSLTAWFLNKTGLADRWIK
jgi:hypothetical protein